MTAGTSCKCGGDVVHDGKCETCIVRALQEWCGRVEYRGRTAWLLEWDTDTNKFAWWADDCSFECDSHHARLAVIEAAEERLRKEHNCDLRYWHYDTRGEWFWIDGQRMTGRRVMVRAGTKLIVLYEAAKHLRSLGDAAGIASAAPQGQE